MDICFSLFDLQPRHFVACIIIPIISHFTILGQQNVQNMPQKYIVKQDQIYKQKNKGTKW